MKKIIAIALVISVIVAIPGELRAKERRGIKVIIHKKDGLVVEGELIAVKTNSILVKDSKSGVDISVEVGNIKLIKNRTTSAKGLGYGFLIGSAYVTAMAIAWKPSLPQSLLAVGIFGSIGAAIGGIMSIFTTRYEFQIEGESEAEIIEIMGKLRKKARVRSYN